jgi:hypothetical protein
MSPKELAATSISLRRYYAGARINPGLQMRSN